ncbi:MAG: pyrroline-5-carboxylate reductase [Lactobacillales bacterium]|jgi:pyrroline-5-carboxylate reductase|nr:pyrroline-5-carboxylate reductase [Lactobacillales bacterium]
MKIGFIGTGNMASAIIDGLLTKGQPEIYVSGRNQEKVEKFAKVRQITACEDNLVLAETADILLLAVKPHVIAGVLKQIQPALATRHPLVISIAAGKTLAQLEVDAGVANLPIIRVMPNVNAQVGAGVAAIVKNEVATEEQLTQATKIFEAVGSVYPLEEKDFSTFIALAGSSPAFVYMFIDAMSRAGVKYGLPKALATEIATQAVLGSAKMLNESNENPWALVDKVSSPGGTTVAGVLALEEAGFISDVVKGIEATIARDKEMSK